MKREKNRFADAKEFGEMIEMLDGWHDDQRKVKASFLQIKSSLLGKDSIFLSFISRPGVSHSLRANFKNLGNRKRPLFALVDVIDDDPENRWLSVCFYVETITDPKNMGNLIPQGILGDDGYCFDLSEFDESMMAYIADRVDEAYSFG